MVGANAADLFRFAYWMTRNRSQAEDLVQETFARAWANWQALVNEKAAKKWLMTILHNEYARTFEKTRPEDGAVEFDEMTYPGVSGRESAIDMRQALERLPESLSEPLLLQVLGGFSGAEIGILLEVSEAAVMQRLTRARNALRSIIEPESVRKKFHELS
jgi:RNA polymerase sigma-70 factor (ECF subfamily)